MSGIRVPAGAPKRKDTLAVSFLFAPVWNSITLAHLSEWDSQHTPTVSPCETTYFNYRIAYEISAFSPRRKFPRRAPLLIHRKRSPFVSPAGSVHSRENSRLDCFLTRSCRFAFKQSYPQEKADAPSRCLFFLLLCGTRSRSLI